MSTAMRIYSWNVNGLRSVLKKGAFQELIVRENPDVVCLQETKAKQGQAECDLPEYVEYWNSAERAGYSGTATFTRFQPLSVTNGFTPEIEQDYAWEEDSCGNALLEGRVQTVEFAPFYLVNVYVPNSKRTLERLLVREKTWDPALLRYLKTLEKTKPVVVCGDFNVAHTALDLARPKDNEKNAGFTEEERQGMKNYLAAGLADTFRYFYPAEQRYTWWTNWARARERNIGWRIDYFLVSEALLPHLKAAEIHEYIMGSDHCPVSIELEF